MLTPLLANASKERVVAGLRVEDKAAHLDLRVIGTPTTSNAKSTPVSSDELKNMPAGTNAGLITDGLNASSTPGLSAVESQPGFAQAQAEIKQATGLDFPGDLQTLAGKGIELSVGSVLRRHAAGGGDVAAAGRPGR